MIHTNRFHKTPNGTNPSASLPLNFLSYQLVAPYKTYGLEAALVNELVPQALL